tara:strand:- start:58 stop:456 length:399 start_codon:yes stop_codon:yes gene_type:complete
MKKLLMLTEIVCSVVLSPVAHAEWTKVTEDKNGTTFYVDLERIRKHKGKVYYWQIQDRKELSKISGDLSNKAYLEVECGPFRQRTLSLSSYANSMAEGTKLKGVEAFSERWFYPPPNSPVETVLKVVCNHKP